MSFVFWNQEVTIRESMSSEMQEYFYCPEGYQRLLSAVAKFCEKGL